MTSTKLLWGPSVFTSESTDPAFTDFNKGQGYHLDSCLPQKGGALKAMKEASSCSTEDHETERTQGWKVFSMRSRISM